MSRRDPYLGRDLHPTRDRPWLVADIGGTNARFGLVEESGAAPTRVQVLPRGDFAGPADAASGYLARYAGRSRPRAACLAIAGPTDGERFQLTNADWTGTVAELRADLKLEHVELINDFQALALALPTLGPRDVRPIGGGALRADRTMAVLGPGTGLGVAALVPLSSGGWVPLATEGGQVDPPAVTQGEAEVVELLHAGPGPVTAEGLLSGFGMSRLYRILARLRGVPAEPLSAAQICARQADPLCAETREMFCALLGTFTRNVALTLGARGGIYLGGGILPRIPVVLERSAFRDRFEAGSPAPGYLEEIATVLITSSTPALAGAAVRLGQILGDGS